MSEPPARLSTKERKTLIAKLKSETPCADCGERFDPVCMDFDHLPGEDKRFGICSQEANRQPWSEVLLEIKKCEVVCANCHRLRTKNRHGEWLSVRRRSRIRTGGIPYGYRLAADGIHLEPDATEQQTIATAKALASQGLSHRRIAEVLTSRGMLSRTARPFAQSQVWLMVTRN